MSVNDELGKRMKEFYENRSKTQLMRRTPVAIRIDGKAFHTFTRGFDKPFDTVLMEAMQDTMKYLCENIQGCVFGYTQSDEITLILTDYKELNSGAWFNYEVQKLCSISASMATLAFNRSFQKWMDAYMDGAYEIGLSGYEKYMEEKYAKYSKALEKGAMFDARCFNIPKEEVCNLVYWRQLDATRNSIQMVGQAYFSQKELQNKSCNDIQDMLMLQKGVNWNNFPVDCKRGAACRKVTREVNIAGTMDTVSTWEIDKKMPILKGEDRKYVEDLIYYA